MQASMLTPVLRAIFLAIALSVVVACSGESPIVGVRGSAGLDNPVFPSFGNGGYDVSHYDLDLTIDLNANTLDAVATIRVTATANLVAFNLDFAGPEVSAVQVNDEPATFTREDNELVIEPATVILDGSEFTVRVTYGGTPEPLLVSKFPFPMGWTRFGGSVIVHGFGLAWYPKNETPLDKATYKMRLNVSKPLIATASGELIETIDNGDTSTYVWEVNVPIDGVAFAVSDSVLEPVPGPDGLTINNYFPSEFAETYSDRFDIVPEMIELFTELFGPFPFDSFGITFLRGNLPFGGFGPPQRAYLLSSDEQSIAHEVSHQWFGGSVSPASPADNWLAEGFATYAEILWIEHTSGTDDAIAGVLSLQRRTGSGTRPPAVVNTPAEILDQAAYARGGLTLHALRQKLGDDDFFEVLRTYTERFKHSAASTTDFISVAEEVSEKDLGDFFDAWVYSRLVPQLDP